MCMQECVRVLVVVLTEYFMLMAKITESSPARICAKHVRQSVIAPIPHRAKVKFVQLKCCATNSNALEFRAAATRSAIWRTFLESVTMTEMKARNSRRFL